MWSEFAHLGVRTVFLIHPPPSANLILRVLQNLGKQLLSHTLLFMIQSWVQRTILGIKPVQAPQLPLVPGIRPPTLRVIQTPSSGSSLAEAQAQSLQTPCRPSPCLAPEVPEFLSGDECMRLDWANASAEKEDKDNKLLSYNVWGRGGTAEFEWEAWMESSGQLGIWITVSNHSLPLWVLSLSVERKIFHLFICETET